LPGWGAPDGGVADPIGDGGGGCGKGDGSSDGGN